MIELQEVGHPVCFVRLSKYDMVIATLMARNGISDSLERSLIMSSAVSRLKWYFYVAVLNNPSFGGLLTGRRESISRLCAYRLRFSIYFIANQFRQLTGPVVQLRDKEKYLAVGV